MGAFTSFRVERAGNAGPFIVPICIEALPCLHGLPLLVPVSMLCTIRLHPVRIAGDGINGPWGISAAVGDIRIQALVAVTLTIVIAAGRKQDQA